LPVKYFLIYLLGINLLTFIIFASDKRMARKKMYRVSEKTSLLLALFGVSFGAWLAQKLFRHKVKKSGFRLRFLMIVILQIAAVVFYFLKYRMGFII